MKSCVKFVCSKVKQCAAAVLPAPYSNVALQIVYQERKGFFCEMERTQFTQYILGKVFAPPRPRAHLFKTCSLTKNTYPVLTRNLQRRCDYRKSVVQNVCVPMKVVTWLCEVLAR